MRDAIRISHEKTEDVRLKCFLTFQMYYEMFTMKKTKIIYEMFMKCQSIFDGLKVICTKFTKALNSLKTLDRLLKIREWIVRKFKKECGSPI